ncbi:MAG: hypothetical protein GAK30_02094 [Paracidovorax wautersii]|uniref:Uncharacterized protein n=1 Tax=Paracidovorax wautersii TaxID=1177982 RepID=A0A7V8FNL9_9BURK|nr:MAG: hypothetical protein GAK30_02094 [Paracidovorax wautersii]
MFNKILSKIVSRQTAPANAGAAAHNSAQQLMEDAERFAGRTPHYASDLRRAAQAQLTLNSYLV